MIKNTILWKWRKVYLHNTVVNQSKTVLARQATHLYPPGGCRGERGLVGLRDGSVTELCRPTEYHHTAKTIHCLITSTVRYEDFSVRSAGVLPAYTGILLNTMGGNYWFVLWIFASCSKVQSISMLYVHANRMYIRYPRKWLQRVCATDGRLYSNIHV